MYKNQSDVDEIRKQIQKIDPTLTINSYSINGQNEVMSVGLIIPIKGNKRKIEQLQNQGWRKLLREKKRTDHNRYIRCQYSGYILVQRMDLSLKN